jgi:hypothetical protein
LFREFTPLASDGRAATHGRPNWGNPGWQKISDETGREYFALGIQSQLSFKAYLERPQKILDNQFYLVCQATPLRKTGLQRVNISTGDRGCRNCRCR